MYHLRIVFFYDLENCISYIESIDSILAHSRLNIKPQTHEAFAYQYSQPISFCL